MDDERDAWLAEEDEPRGHAHVGLSSKDVVQVTTVESNNESISVLLDADVWFAEMRRLGRVRQALWPE